MCSVGPRVDNVGEGVCRVWSRNGHHGVITLCYNTYGAAQTKSGLVDFLHVDSVHEALGAFSMAGEC